MRPFCTAGWRTVLVSGGRSSLAAVRRARRADRWTLRARPAFLYVMYGLLLWSVPVGLIGGVWPEAATAISRAMREYFEALPEPLYALFGTGYLGYTAARTWGKVKGVER